MKGNEIEEYVEVCINDVGKVDFPGVIRSGNLDNCIAIGIYDPSTKKGYMVREFPLGCGEITSRMNDLKGEFDKLSELIVCAVGTREKSEDKEIAENESKIERDLESALKEGFNQERVCIRWLPSEVYAELVLDTKKEGKFELHYHTLN